MHLKARKSQPRSHGISKMADTAILERRPWERGCERVYKRATYLKEMSRVHEVTCTRALNYSPTFFHPACTVPGGRRVHAWSWVWRAVSESAVNKVGGDGTCDVSSRRSCFVFSVTLSSLNDIPPGSVQIKFLGFFSFFILKKIRLTRERELLFLLILVMTYSK